MPDLRDNIVGGLDYYYARAVIISLFPAPTRPELESAVRLLRFSIENKLSAKNAKTNRWIIEYRATLAGEAPHLVLDTLNIVEGFSAAVGARKLEERLRQEIFNSRQLRIPGT